MRLLINIFIATILLSSFVPLSGVFSQTRQKTMEKELPGGGVLHAGRYMVNVTVAQMDSGQFLYIHGPIPFRSKLVSAVGRLFAAGQVDSSGAPNGRFWLYSTPDMSPLVVDSLKLIDSVLVDTGLYNWVNFNPTELDKDSAKFQRNAFIVLKYSIDQNFGPDTQIGDAGDTSGGVWPSRYGGLHGGKPDTLKLVMVFETTE